MCTAATGGRGGRGNTHRDERCSAAILRCGVVFCCEADVLSETCVLLRSLAPCRAEIRVIVSGLGHVLKTSGSRDLTSHRSAISALGKVSSTRGPGTALVRAMHQWSTPRRDSCTQLPCQTPRTGLWRWARTRMQRFACWAITKRSLRWQMHSACHLPELAES